MGTRQLGERGDVLVGAAERFPSSTRHNHAFIHTSSDMPSSYYSDQDSVVDPYLSLLEQRPKSKALPPPVLRVEEADDGGFTSSTQQDSWQKQTLLVDTELASALLGGDGEGEPESRQGRFLSSHWSPTTVASPSIPEKLMFWKRPPKPHTSSAQAFSPLRNVLGLKEEEEAISGTEKKMEKGKKRWATTTVCKIVTGVSLLSLAIVLVILWTALAKKSKGSTVLSDSSNLTEALKSVFPTSMSDTLATDSLGSLRGQENASSQATTEPVSDGTPSSEYGERLFWSGRDKTGSFTPLFTSAITPMQATSTYLSARVSSTDVALS